MIYNGYKLTYLRQMIEVLLKCGSDTPEITYLAGN